MSLKDICVNTYFIDKHIAAQDKEDQSQEYINQRNEKLLNEAKDAIYEYNQAMKDLSEDMGLSGDWWNLKDDLEIS